MGIRGWERVLPCLLAGVLAAAAPARAAIIVPADRKDAAYRSDNSWDETIRTGRVGASMSEPGPGSRTVVFPFLLPPAPPGPNPVSAASLTFTVVQDFGHVYNIDLYGLPARSDGGAREEDNFLGGPLDPNATPIQKAIISAPGDIASSTLRPVSTSSTGNLSLVDYLNAQYLTTGPAGGQFVFLRLNPDVVPPTELSGVTVNMADNLTGNTPILTIEFVPEPSTAFVAAIGIGLMGLGRRRGRCDVRSRVTG